MCDISNHLILSETDNCQITWCSGCRTYSLIFNNCCASFTEPEFKQYKCILDNLKTADFHYDLLGKGHALLKNPKVNVGFCLTQDDATKLTDLIGQALVMSEAYQIVKQ
ncbi:MAG: DUF6686 family protein [Bacteroidota bacterium]